MLRDMYMHRSMYKTFQSFILAGVYDIRNLKLRIRPESKEKNSPWNIAADLEVDMSFSSEEISTMLSDYDRERGIGMDVEHVSDILRQLTSGYPYMVSRMCLLVDRAIKSSDANPLDAWSDSGLYAAAKTLSEETNNLFESLDDKIRQFPELKQKIQDIVFNRTVPISTDYEPWVVGSMLGFLKNKDGNMALSNRILESRFANNFLAEQSIKAVYPAADKSLFISEGVLDMDLVIGKFAEYYTDYYSDKTQEYLEKECMIDFLLFLRPIINGGGNLFIETEIRNRRRLDIVVYHNYRIYVIELKKWHGIKHLEKGEKQLLDYLDYYRLDKGYLITFSFLKSKKVGVSTKLIGEKTIVEAIV
jgi:hypothetical protein